MIRLIAGCIAAKNVRVDTRERIGQKVEKRIIRVVKGLRQTALKPWHLGAAQVVEQPSGVEEQKTLGVIRWWICSGKPSWAEVEAEVEVEKVENSVVTVVTRMVAAKEKKSKGKGWDSGPYAGGKAGKDIKSAGKGNKGGGPSMRNFPPETKVWVGNLPANATVDSVKEHFGLTGGTVKSAAIMNGNTAAVAYENAEEAAQAIAVLNMSDMGGKAIQVDVWTGK